MATFVLVHGAWHGAWCWRRVTRLLTAHGHEVFAPTLTGVGERSHLRTLAIDLRTHIADVVNLMKWERLDRLVLVGHSYGGMIASGVAEDMGGAISSIVFLDAFYPDSGQSLADQAIKITATGSRQPRKKAKPYCRHAPPRRSTSTRRTAAGSMRCACHTRSAVLPRSSPIPVPASASQTGPTSVPPAIRTKASMRPGRKRRPTAGGSTTCPAGTT